MPRNKRGSAAVPVTPTKSAEELRRQDRAELDAARLAATQEIGRFLLTASGTPLSRIERAARRLARAATRLESAAAWCRNTSGNREL